MKRILALTLAAMMLFSCILTLSACRDSIVEKEEESFPNSDPQKASEALKKKEYNVVFIDKGLPEGYAASLEAVKGQNFILITYYSDETLLETEWLGIQGSLEAIKSNHASIVGIEAEDVIIKKHEKMVYIATNQAIKDTQ